MLCQAWIVHTWTTLKDSHLTFRRILHTNRGTFLQDIYIGFKKEAVFGKNVPSHVLDAKRREDLRLYSTSTKIEENNNLALSLGFHIGLGWFISVEGPRTLTSKQLFGPMKRLVLKKLIYNRYIGLTDVSKFWGTSRSGGDFCKFCILIGLGVQPTEKNRKIQNLSIQVEKKKL